MEYADSGLPPPRRARTQSRMAPPGQDAWDAAGGAGYAPQRRPRSPPGRAATGLDAGGFESRGATLSRMAAAGDENGAAYAYDERDAWQGGVNGDGRRHAPQGAPSWRGGPPGAAAPAPHGSWHGSQPERGAPPPGYGYAQQGPSGGWVENPLAAPSAPHGQPGGWDGQYTGGQDPGGGARPATTLRRRSYHDHEAGSSEQWRQIQATLAAQTEAAKVAAQQAMAARRGSGSHAGALRRALGYAARRSWYLVDSKIGTLKYQVLALIGVAVIISVSGGKVVQVVRDMAVEEGLLESYTTYSDGVWLAWSLIIDPGYGTWPDSVVGVRMRAVTVIIVIIGILYLSVIIALIVDAVQVKMEDLKKVSTRDGACIWRAHCPDCFSLSHRACRRWLRRATRWCWAGRSSR
jgi:hypothetical protein